MMVDSIYELRVCGVYDRGVPNQERIVITANAIVNLGQYGLMLGIRAVGNTAFPIKDNLLWFGDGYLNRNDWLFVYTGPGSPNVSTVPNSTEKLYTVHWGRDVTILHNKEVVPILFRVDAVKVPLETIALPPG